MIIMKTKTDDENDDDDDENDDDNDKNDDDYDVGFLLRDLITLWNKHLISSLCAFILCSFKR